MSWILYWLIYIFLPTRVAMPLNEGMYYVRLLLLILRRFCFYWAVFCIQHVSRWINLTVMHASYIVIVSICWQLWGGIGELLVQGSEDITSIRLVKESPGS
jgi:hypothetical protein